MWKWLCIRDRKVHINFIDHGVNYVISGDSAELFSIANGFWKMKNIGKPVFVKENKLVCRWFCFLCGEKNTCPQRWFCENKTLTSPIAVDYLIIGNKMKPKMKLLLDNVHPAKVIVDNTISDWYTEHVKGWPAPKIISVFIQLRKRCLCAEFYTLASQLSKQVQNHIFCYFCTN